MEKKVCRKCKIEKDTKEFGKDKRTKDGLYYYCKCCRKQYQIDNKEKIKKYKRKNKEEKRQYDKQYNQKNKEKIKQKKKQYYQNNKKEKKQYSDRYYQEHKEEKKQYTQNHKEEKKYHINKRYQEDVVFRLRYIISSSLRRMIKKNNSRKKDSFLKFLPYTIQELRLHIEKQFDSWMNWGNYGVYRDGEEKKWHIDHIIPQSLLPYDSMEHPNFQKCWSLDNLRPLEALENIKKGNKTNVE